MACPSPVRTFTTKSLLEGHEVCPPAAVRSPSCCLLTRGSNHGRARCLARGTLCRQGVGTLKALQGVPHGVGVGSSGAHSLAGRERTAARLHDSNAWCCPDQPAHASCTARLPILEPFRTAGAQLFFPIFPCSPDPGVLPAPQASVKG